MKKGYAAFHHPLLVHGSYANKSSRPRRAFVLNVFADGTYSDSDDELLQGVPAIPKGKKLEGQFFPLLFDPGKWSLLEKNISRKGRKVKPAEAAEHDVLRPLRLVFCGLCMKYFYGMLSFVYGLDYF